MTAVAPDQTVLPVAALDAEALRAWLAGFALTPVWVADGAQIPGSYWGDSEAGLISNGLYLRRDTPVHSLLHETCHYICMDAQRRAHLHTDACGSDTEENAVCYLQALLADTLPGYSRARLFADMDAWGYHFILGSAQAWFERDSQDARAWLSREGLIDAAGGFLHRLRA